MDSCVSAVRETTQTKLPHQSAHAQKSQFLQLPPELRNVIYVYALIAETDVEVPASGKVAKPALLQACRQTMSEATPIYYGQNTFKTRCDGPLTNSIRWLASMTLQARQSLCSLSIEHDINDGLDSLHELLASIIVGKITCSAKAATEIKGMAVTAANRALVSSRDGLLTMVHHGLRPEAVRFIGPARPDLGAIIQQRDMQKVRDGLDQDVLCSMAMLLERERVAREQWRAQ